MRPASRLGALIALRLACAAIVPPEGLVADSSGGNAASVFDQSTYTYFDSSDGAVWVQANFTAHAWHVDSYSISTSALPLNLRPAAPRSASSFAFFSSASRFAAWFPPRRPRCSAP